MSRRLVLLVCAIGAGVVVSAGPQDSPPQLPPKPIFRSATDLVSVNVSVKDGTQPVAGLAAADFELLDNGIRQKIDALSIESVPIDVSIVLDLSGSVTADVGPFQADIRQFVAMLRPTDRIRLVSFADDVRELAPMRAPSSPLGLEQIKVGGSTSLNDGLLYALLWTGGQVDRRHLIVVFTDGFDSHSTLDNDSIPKVAGRVDAVLHAVLAESPVPIFARYHGSLDALVAASRQTGGEAHRLGRAVDDFRQIVDDFRASYVLRYTPQGVERGGWHALTVRVVKTGRYTVRARQGYEGS